MARRESGVLEIRTAALPHRTSVANPIDRTARHRASWRVWFIYVHRWLGIACGLLFVAWFASGIVMMYHRMPTVTVAERLAHAELLDVERLRLTPAEAATAAGARSAAGIVLGMLEGRPVYRLGRSHPSVVFADDGSPLGEVGPERAMAVAMKWSSGVGTPSYDRLLGRSDQWTLQNPSRTHLPLHRVRLGDPDGTVVYISTRTGEVVMQTTRSERFWGYLGPVTHWLYLPMLRRHGPIWTWVILVTSGVGCVMCLSGLVVGLFQWSPSARYRRRRGGTRTPYSGLLWWHHYTGLAFGVLAFTWTFSGLLSMGPFAWSEYGSDGVEQRRIVSGEPRTEGMTAETIRSAVEELGRSTTPRELTLSFFQGAPYWTVDGFGPLSDHEDAPNEDTAPFTPLLVSALDPSSGAFERFDDASMERVARAVMPGVDVEEATWIHAYDAYYYGRPGERPLPVLRVAYADSLDTRIYFDPRRGTIALASRPGVRLNRWLYQGLHSLDFPGLYNARPWWDLVVILLSLGGLVVSATTLLPSWRRLRRHGKAFARRTVTEPAASAGGGLSDVANPVEPGHRAPSSSTPSPAPTTSRLGQL